MMAYVYAGIAVVAAFCGGFILGLFAESKMWSKKLAWMAKQKPRLSVRNDGWLEAVEHLQRTGNLL